MIPVRDFPPVKELPEVFDAAILAKTIDITKWKAYSLFRSENFPFYNIDGKKSVFRSNFVEWLSGQPITPLEQLEVIQKFPENFPPKLLQSVLAVSKSKVYTLVHARNFPAMQLEGQIIVNKSYFILWLKTKRNLGN